MNPQPPNPRSVFGRAIEIESPADRRAFLDQACAGAPEVRDRVEALLRAHDAAGGFLRPHGAEPDGTDNYTPTPDAPAAVGPYKLLEKIGEGGMGEVWVADQLEPIKRRVALKLIKPGMDSRGVLARFEAERQALAVMDHPNIARVLDAGTTPDGRPYFVMELVKGTPITEFCDIRKLTPKERLELFVPVCQAIQHAHMKGIIHRDIKPSNVLVELYDDRPVPKVIDFGVAKAIGQQLTEKTLYTGFGALVGTPAYMAPEQATFNALDVDTRADVYALGVLLYELLAGSPPIEKERLKQAALDEVLRIVRDEEPMRPSQRLSTSQTKASIAATRQSEPGALSQMMKGELDWIVMKALEKDRTRRYDTASNFAADVQRYLSGEQVQAVPPSLGYRLKKAYRRNRAAVLTGGLIALALLTATGVSVAFGLLADASRRQAATDRETALAAEHEAERRRKEADDANVNLRLTQEDLSGALGRAERLLYASQITQADAAARNLRPKVLASLLADAGPKPGRPDLRGWEWHYLDRLTHSWDTEVPLDLKAVPGLEQRVWRDFHFTADGERLLVPPYRSPTPDPQGDPSRREVAEGPGAVFDTATGKLLRVIPLPTKEPLAPYDVSFSSDGLFMGFPEREKDGPYRVRMVEVATGKDIPMPFPPTDFVPQILVAPGAKRVVVYQDQSPLTPKGARPPAAPIRVWDRGAAALREIAVQTPEGVSKDEMVSVLPTADGTTAAVLRGNRSSRGERELEFWDLTADPLVRRSTTKVELGGVRRIVFSPNGQSLGISADSSTIRMFDVTTGKLTFDWPIQGSDADGSESEQTRFDISLSLLSDIGENPFTRGQLLVLRERENVFRLVTGMGRPAGPGRREHRPVFLFGPLSTSHSLGSSTGQLWLAASGNRLLHADSGMIRSWDLWRSRGFDQPILRLPGEDGGFGQVQPVGNPRFAAVYQSAGPTGGKFGRAPRPESTVGIYDLAAGRVRNKLTVPGQVAQVEIARNGDAVLIATRAQPAELPTWHLHSLDEPRGNPRVVQFASQPPRSSPNGQPKSGGLWRFAELPSFTADGQALIEPVLKRPEVPEPSSSGTSHVYGFNLRRAADGVVVREVRYPETERVQGPPQANPDGTRLVVLTASPTATNLYCYDTRTGRQVWHRELSDSGPLPSNAVCRHFPDVNQFAVAWEAAAELIRVRVLDTESGTEIRTLQSPVTQLATGIPLGTPVLLALGPAGRVAVHNFREVLVWDGTSPASVPHRLVGHNGRVGRMLFSADGRRLFTLDLGTNAITDVTIRVWDVGLGRELLTFRVSGIFRPSPFSGGLVSGWNLADAFWMDGDRLYFHESGRVRVFDGTPRPESKK